jgi:photosystem II stability/assembly factor-like uncharacterized protein
MSQVSRTNQRSGLDETAQQELKWLVSGKGMRPQALPKRSTTPSIDRFDPEETGSAETPKKYFEGWYGSNPEWSPEMQKSAFEHGQTVNKEARRERSTLSAIPPWQQKGPYGMRVFGSNPPKYLSGRVSALDFNPSTGLLVGAASGGLWKFETFIVPLPVPLSDQLPTLTVGGVAIHPTNPDTMYLGTGEYHVRAGTGVYATYDGGATWSLLPLSPTPSAVSKILIAPWNPNLVIVASTAGIFRSSDNGASWTHTYTHPVSDLASAPDGSYMLAGAEGVGVIRSTFLNRDGSPNQGKTWIQLTSGLPSLHVGRISLDISSSDPNRAYVQISNDSTRQALGVFRSENANAGSPAWTNITPTGIFANYMFRQGGYNNVLAIKPNNSSLVWIGGGDLLRSTDAGLTWTLSNPYHPDIHALKYSTANDVLYIGSDGGVFSSDDDGETWSTNINTLLPITQFYNIDVSDGDARVKYGAAQDNGTSGTSVTDPDVWVYSDLADGIDVHVDRSDVNLVYGTSGTWDDKWMRRRTTNGGSSWSFINGSIAEEAPGFSIFIDGDPFRPDHVVSHAGNFVYFSTNEGNSWARVNPSALNDIVRRVYLNFDGNVIYAQTPDASQRLMRFDFSPVSNSWSQHNLTAGLPAKNIKRMCLSLNGASQAYVLFLGVGDNDKIFKTTDKGGTWTNITGNLPDIPVNALLEDPHSDKVLWIGTDQGVFKTVNGGTSWYRWMDGMPGGAIVTDLDYAPANPPFIVAGTYGRSTFERSAAGSDRLIQFNTSLLNFGSYEFTGRTQIETLKVSNPGDADLTISNVISRNGLFRVSPGNAMIPAGGSLSFSVFLYSDTPLPPGNISSEIEFYHDGENSPAVVMAAAYVGDGTQFRTFTPESLIVKKPTPRKPTFTSWCFSLSNDVPDRDPASVLHVEFKNKASIVTGYEPFTQAENVDGKGKAWEFSGGVVNFGNAANICGRTRGRTTQKVVRSWWLSTGGSMLGEAGGIKLPDTQSPGLEMPNAANFRQEIFAQVPFNRNHPLVVGVADPDAKSKKVAYVVFAREGDLLGSLTPGRSGKRHDGPPRCFDFFDNGREMIGKISKLTPDKQSNHLFGELVALKLNIYGSQTEKTPLGFGELKYADPGHRLDGLTIHQIDSLANTYMTYCDSSAVGSAVELDSVIHKINSAFEGPRDTISFASKLRFTGVRPIGDVTYLKRDPAAVPARINSIYTPPTEPEEFELSQNYPNPFNPTTTISFRLPEPAIVTLKIYNTLGQQVAKVIDREEMADGLNEVEFDGRSLTSGVYFYRIEAQVILDEEEGLLGKKLVAVKKMLLIK